MKYLLSAVWISRRSYCYLLWVLFALA